MYKSFLVLVILMILFGCAEGNDIFLDKFITLDEMPTSKSIKDLKFTDTIPTKDLKEVLLVDANAGYTPQFSKKGYYYIGKYKLNNDLRRQNKLMRRFIQFSRSEMPFFLLEVSAERGIRG